MKFKNKKKHTQKAILYKLKLVNFSSLSFGWDSEIAIYTVIIINNSNWTAQ